MIPTTKWLTRLAVLLMFLVLPWGIYEPDGWRALPPFIQTNETHLRFLAEETKEIPFLERRSKRVIENLDELKPGYKVLCATDYFFYAHVGVAMNHPNMLLFIVGLCSACVLATWLVLLEARDAKDKDH